MENPVNPKMIAFLLLPLLIGLVQSYGVQNYGYSGQSSYSFENHKYCDDLSPHYGNISLDQIQGVWYGVEKIPHMKGEYRIEHTHECFYIDIKENFVEPTSPSAYPSYTNSPLGQYTKNSYGYGYGQQYGQPEHHRVRHFVLEWHEGLWQDDYHVKVNTSHKAFWPTDVPSRSVDQMYRFFGGVIQVLTVANNHLVLNFCMRLPHSQMFSVVLSRNHNQLTSEDLAMIHNVFTMKHLSTSSLKRVCENAGDSIKISSFVLVLALILVLRSRV